MIPIEWIQNEIKRLENEIREEPFWKLRNEEIQNYIKAYKYLLLSWKNERNEL